MTGLNPTDRKAVSIATLGPIGKIPVAPGTWGSLAAVIVWWLILSRLRPFWYWTVMLIVTVIGVWSAGRAEEELGKDAGEIVIDEVVGQWLTLAVCSRNVCSVVLAFLIFRLLDIWKPFPIRKSQDLPGGTGVVIDDVLAGAYGLVLMWIFRWMICD